MTNSENTTAEKTSNNFIEHIRNETDDRLIEHNVTKSIVGDNKIVFSNTTHDNPPENSLSTSDTRSRAQTEHIPIVAVVYSNTHEQYTLVEGVSEYPGHEMLTETIGTVDTLAESIELLEKKLGGEDTSKTPTNELSNHIEQVEFDTGTTFVDLTERDNTRHHMEYDDKTGLWVSYTVTTNPRGDETVRVNDIGHIKPEETEVSREELIDQFKTAKTKLIENTDDEDRISELKSAREEAYYSAETIIEEWTQQEVWDPDQEFKTGTDNDIENRMKWGKMLSDCISMAVDRTGDDTEYSIKVATGEDNDGLRVGEDFPVYDLATFRIESEPWEQRAFVLTHLGRFPWRRACVVALKEAGMPNQGIAMTLEVGESTVSRHLTEAKKMVKQANWVVENDILQEQV